MSRGDIRSHTYGPVVPSATVHGSFALSRTPHGRGENSRMGECSHHQIRLGPALIWTIPTSLTATHRGVGALGKPCPSTKGLLHPCTPQLWVSSVNPHFIIIHSTICPPRGFQSTVKATHAVRFTGVSDASGPGKAAVTLLAWRLPFRGRGRRPHGYYRL